MVMLTDTPARFKAAVRAAAERLRAGEVVAVPTETVYGLAANALDPGAVEKVFAVKGRPARNPIIVHVASVEMARRCVARFPKAAAKLADAFWPGPLTLVLPKSAIIPGVVTAGGPTVGIRWPSHPVTEAIIRVCGFPLAAPSANASGQVSPTTAEHVRRSLGSRISLIVDSGPAIVGIESTVLDLSVSPPRVLRPGIVDAEALEAVVGTVRAPDQERGEVLRSPGLLLKHYAPKARVIIWSGSQEELKRRLARMAIAPERVHLLIRRQPPVVARFGRICAMPQDPKAFARALYAELHRSDQAGAGVIVIEAVPDEPEWSAIADRLRRAAA